jgi:lipid-binding SYLF domain-containing protein
MRKHLFISVVVVVLIGSACATIDPDSAAQRSSIDALTDEALATLNAKVPGSGELIAEARGVLVFPSVITAGLVVGGSWGEGELRSGGATVGYYSTGRASAGAIAGADSKAIYVLFMTQEALDKFRKGYGWTVGADASVTVLQNGANATVDTQSVQHPVVAYVLAKSGLLVDVSLEGAKVSRVDI